MLATLELTHEFFDHPYLPSSTPITALYLLRQQPCQCVNSTLPCASAASKTAPVVPELNADGKPLPFNTVLQENVWYNSSITDAWQSQYVKFDIPASLASRCPIITLEVQTEIGGVSLYVSAQAIPDLGQNDFARSATGASTLVICPTQPNFFYGTYYVNIQSDLYDTNIFAIRYTIASSPTCMSTTAAAITAHTNYPSSPNSIWLQDGVMSLVEVRADVRQTYRYFQLYTEGKCADFSVTAHSTAGVDMLASLYVIANENTQANETSVLTAANSWTVPHISTASLNFRFCNPSDTATSNVFYIGIKFGQSLVLNATEAQASRYFQLVATAQQYTPAVPLASFGYLQSKIDLSYGAAPTVTCGTVQSRCQRHAYTFCIADYIGCCDSFFPIPPEEHVQSIWPWNAGDSTVDSSFYGEIDWRGMQPLVPGKLAFAVYLHWRTPSGFTVVMPATNPSCKVELGGSLVDSTGALPDEDLIDFSPAKKPTCDLETYREIDNGLDKYTDAMLNSESSTDMNALGLNQLQLLIQAWDDTYYGCRNVMTSYVNMSTEYLSSYPASVCTHIAGSAAWLDDGCCNPQQYAFKTCIPTTIQRAVTPDGIINAPLMEEKCASPECSITYTDNWLDNIHLLANEKSGCMNTVYQAANPTLFRTAQQFSLICMKQIDPTYTMSTDCMTDDDCFGAASCNPVTKLCNNTEDLLLQCIAENIPFDTAAALYNIWGLQGEPSTSGLLNGPIQTYGGSAAPATLAYQAAARASNTSYNNSILAAKWINDQCVGPTARQYRNGYQFARTDPNCVDECLLFGIEPFCVHHEASESCPVPSMCNRATNGSSSICSRTWVYVERDLDSCVQDEICNWRLNETFPCVPQEDEDQCAAKCESVEFSDQVCLDCSRSVLGTCIEITDITTQSRCDQGICTTNATATTDCASYGVCTLPCGPDSVIDPEVSPFYPGAYSSCTSQAACESSRRCTDHDLFAPLSSTQTGICLMPITWLGFYSSCGVDGWSVADWTCANFDAAITETNCAAQADGAYWYTFATDEETCSGDSAPHVCFWNTYQIWLARTENECGKAADTFWITANTWKSGNWTPGYIQPLTWEERGMFKPNEIRRSFDYIQLYDDVRAAVAQQFSFAYYTGSLCRYGATTDIVTVVVCNCHTDGGSECFTKASTDDSFTNKVSGEELLCPYQSRTLSTLAATMYVPSNAMPYDVPCTPLNISSTPIGAYLTPPNSGASRPLFNKVQNDPSLVVVNRNEVIVGQILSDAVYVSYNFTAQAEMSLCIYMKNMTVDSATNIYRLSRLLPNKSIRVVDDTRITVTTVERNNAFNDGVRALNSTSELLCGYISQPGTYFASAVLPDYNTIDDGLSGQSIASLILFIMLFFFAFIQLILLILDRDRQRLLPFKIVALSIIMLTVIARIIAIQPNTIFQRGDESVEFIVYELPTFFYFSVFTVIVYLWLLVVITTNNFGNRRALDMKRPLIRHVFIALNIVMYAVFIIFIFLLAILPGYDKNSPCFQGDYSNTTSNTARGIKIAYWVVQLVISLTLALGFAAAAFLLIRIVSRLRRRNLGRTNGSRTTEGTTGSRSHGGSRTSRTDDSIDTNGAHHEGSDDGPKRPHPANPRTAAGIQMIIITTVAITCIVFLVIRAAIFLYYAYLGGGLPIILFCLLEVIPQSMLVFYLHPFRCFREAGRSSTTSKGTRSGGMQTTYRTSTNGATGTSQRVSKGEI